MDFFCHCHLFCCKFLWLMPPTGIHFICSLNFVVIASYGYSIYLIADFFTAALSNVPFLQSQQWGEDPEVLGGSSNFEKGYLFWPFLIKFIQCCESELVNLQIQAVHFGNSEVKNVKNLITTKIKLQKTVLRSRTVPPVPELERNCKKKKIFF